MCDSVRLLFFFFFLGRGRGGVGGGGEVSPLDPTS